MASIRKRGPHQWQARIYKGGKASSRTFETKTKAEAWARQTEADMDRGVWQDRTEAEKTTLAELSMARLKSTHIAQWRDARLANVKPDTLLREWNLLHHVIESARKDWGINIENPMTLVSKCQRRLKSDPLWA